MEEPEIQELIARLTAEGRYRRLFPVIRQWSIETSRSDAFDRAAREFPPISMPLESATAAPPIKTEDPPETTRKRKKPDPSNGSEPPTARDEKDYRLAIDWVVSKLEDRAVSQSQAPSSAAWAMLVWARSSEANRTKFFCDLLPKVLPTKQQLEREARFQDDGRVLKLVRELLNPIVIEDDPQ